MLPKTPEEKIQLFFPSGTGQILVLDERGETKLNHFTLCILNCKNALSPSLPLSKDSSLAGATVLKSGDRGERVGEREIKI